LALALFPELLNTLGISPEYQFILFGLGALTFARHPEGLLEFAKRRQLDAIQRMIDRRRRGGRAPDLPPGAAELPAVPAPVPTTPDVA
jgi:hypothetical protein